MDSLFITLPKDTFVFRAKTPDNMILGNWFGQSIEDVRGYGTHIGEFKIQKDLKFINISSLQFFNNFLDLLNIRINAPTIKETNNQKATLLFPIGLFGYESQKELLLNINPAIQISDLLNIDIETSLHYFNNKSRVSIHNIDTTFAQTINILYNTVCDGFISPLRWPSKIQNGFMLKELYIFNISDVILEREFDLPSSGGTVEESIENKIILPMYYPKEVTDAAFRKIYGGTGPINITITKDPFPKEQTKIGGAVEPAKFILPDHDPNEIPAIFGPINISMTNDPYGRAIRECLTTSGGEDQFVGMPSKETPEWVKLIEKPVKKKKNITRKRRNSEHL